MDRNDVVLTTQLGPITATLQGNGRAFLRVAAHLNDDAPALEYKGEQWIGSLHAQYAPDSQMWVMHPHGQVVGPSWRSRTRDWNSETPRTYAAAITKAVLEALTAYATPLLLAEADERAALQDVGRAENKVNEIREELAAAEAALSDARLALADAAAEVWHLSDAPVEV